MTADEMKAAKKLADGGNTDTMLQIADFFYEIRGEKPDALEIAKRYYALAAQSGESRAILVMRDISAAAADTSLSLVDVLGKNESMKGKVYEAYRWEKTAFDKGLFTDRKQAEDRLLERISHLAGFYYLENSCSEILQIAEGVDHPYANVLCGLARYQLASCGEDRKNAFDSLKDLQNDLAWKEEYTQYKFQRHLLVDAAQALAVLYYELRRDATAAFHVLEMTQSHLQYVDRCLRQQLEEVMSCYQKGAFGRYKYTGPRNGEKDD